LSLKLKEETKALLEKIHIPIQQVKIDSKANKSLKGKEKELKKSSS
jgi:hypothetical protein